MTLGYLISCFPNGRGFTYTNLFWVLYCKLVGYEIHDGGVIFDYENCQKGSHTPPLHSISCIPRDASTLSSNSLAKYAVRSGHGWSNSLE